LRTGHRPFAGRPPIGLKAVGKLDLEVWRNREKEPREGAQGIFAPIHCARRNVFVEAIVGKKLSTLST
jgi:hypothetical protein